MSPSTIILVGANLLPLVGVAFWGWDAFVLLILYWLETAIIGFWVVVRVLVVQPEDGTLMNFQRAGGKGRPVGRVGTALFLTLHAGIFMGVHLLFLWSLFSGDWAERVHGVGDFAHELVVGTGLWLPLLVLFVVRGWPVVKPVIPEWLPVLAEEPQPSADPALVVGLYVRIFVMQVAIILGGWVVMLSGQSVGALVLLVVGKTLAEVYFGPLTRHIEDATRKAAAERDGTA